MSPVATAPAASSTRVTTWELDPVHSQAQFAVRHMMISTVRGEFTKITGMLVLDEQDVSRSMLEAHIDVASISTREADRDTHLKSADFFDVENFPTISFTSKRVTKDRSTCASRNADTSLYHLPPDADEEALVMLSDILPTGFECGVLNGQVKPGVSWVGT